MRKRGLVTGIPFFERRVQKPPREWSVVDYLPIDTIFQISPFTSNPLPRRRPMSTWESMGCRACHIFTAREDFPLRLPKCMAYTPNTHTDLL